MQKTAHIVLVGPMGAGKSAVGRALAARLGRPFVDLDEQVEATAGMAIAELFERHGEAAFRRQESHALRHALAGPAAVIATGGGAVLDADHRQWMRDAGQVVYLRVSPQRQLERVAGDARRPLLRTADPARRLADLQAQREPLYRDLADLEFDTSEHTPTSAAAALYAALAGRGVPA